MSETTNKPASKEEIIIGLEKLRQRYINDILTAGKKLKLSKKSVEKKIEEHPEILKIDKYLEELHSK